jgi:hypothetical protein
MERISAYKSASGLVSENKTEVEKDEAKFLLTKAVSNLVDEKCWSSMTKSDVTEFILENKSELKKIL